MDFIRSLMNKKVLLTGASGFIGQKVAEIGIKYGVNLYMTSYDEFAICGKKSIFVNISDEGEIKKIINDIRPDVIIHLAAIGVAYGTGSESDIFTVNTLGAINLMNAIKNSSLSNTHLIMAGSGFEYGIKDRPLNEDDYMWPNSIYGVSKASSSMLASIYSKIFPISILRIFSVYGPGEKEPRIVPYIISQAKKGIPIELTAGEQIRDYTYVYDIAEAFWRAAGLPSIGKLQIMNVSKGQSETLRSFVEKLGQLLELKGVKPVFRFGSKEYRKDEIMYYAADIGRLSKYLGWNPKTSIEEGLKLTLDKIL